MPKTLNVRVSETLPIPTPSHLRNEFACSPTAEKTVLSARRTIADLLRGADQRLLVVVGPCSVHDPDAAREYAERLKAAAQPLSDRLLVVMRVYFEKPRTTIGWKGFINDPHLDGSEDIASGLRQARELLCDIAELGMPAATEFLDPIAPQYIADLVSWAAIGARTTESQTHREMASGLSMPVGFKNGTDGSLDVALNAMISASQPHSFLGVDQKGRVSIIRTEGNPDGHIVLRGGSRGPNYERKHIEQTLRRLRAGGLPEKVLIDCAHGNSGKCITKQRQVAEHIAEQVRSGVPGILGVMLESQLAAGRQDLIEKAKLRRGVSITDPCMDLPTTLQLLEELAEVASGRFDAPVPKPLTTTLARSRRSRARP
jgi:3-deoxy-7-phosphoheptulonate synthase